MRKDFFINFLFFIYFFVFIRKVVVIRFSYLTQCLITASVDIIFIDLATEYYVQKQQFTKSMSHSSLPRDIFWGGGDKSMFSSIWLIWKVVTIRFSHCKQCLIVTSFDIVSWTSLFFNTIFASVNPNFCFLLYLNVKKVILLLNASNFYKLLLFFN